MRAEQDYCAKRAVNLVCRWGRTGKEDVTAMTHGGRIGVGIGGWTYEPWRGIFYPPGLPHARELEHAASSLSAIEINGTYYSLQKPEIFRRWAQATPPGFLFAVKGSRFCTNRRVLAEAEAPVRRFLGQGLTELGDKLGPILWQFMPGKAFDPADFGAFLDLLPREWDGLALRHAVEVRHESFRDPAFVALTQRAGVAVVFADSPKYPAIADVTADFIYARLQHARAEEESGYAPAELDHWAAIAAAWARGKSPAGLEYASPVRAPERPRDVFIFMINGAKIRAPAAAVALIDRIGQ